MRFRLGFLYLIVLVVMGMLAWLPKPSPSDGPEAEITDSIRGAGANPTDILAAIGLRGLSLGDLLALAGPRLSPPTGSPLDRLWPSRVLQVELLVPPVSNGQFVWGPNVGSFDPRAFLRGKGSPLADHGDDVALWASYSSVNPKLLLATLEYRYGLIGRLPPGASAGEIRGLIGDTAVTMATAYYEHLYAWGERRPSSSPPPAGPPTVVLEDGTTAVIDSEATSGSYGLAVALAASSNAGEFVAALTPTDLRSFGRVFGSLFPDVDLQSTANDVTPTDLPAATLLQFPFPLGATWRFGGPHSWNGDGTPPFSSMDFFSGNSSCSAPAYLYSVSAASGAATRMGGYTCWMEIDHGAGWTTSYYHLRNMGLSGGVERNAALGTIACEVCAGGFATGPHVHFSLKYNGAYVSLEGIRLSGWTVHVGSVPYNSGSIERGAASLGPYSQVLNDYHVYYGSGLDASLQYFGNPDAGVDRVRLPVDNPLNPNQEPPVDGIGSDDFTIDFWLRALPGDNPAGSVACGANANWSQGNIVLDRRRSGQGREYGVSLANGRVVFGVTGSPGASLTLCGTTNVADGEWHHASLQRNRWAGVSPDGFLWLFVDGRLEASGAGPGGEVDYPNSVTPVAPVDPYLFLGGDKYGTGLSFKGWIDELRVSNILRTRLDFTPPTGPYTADTNTSALFHFDEGVGNLLYDTSGFGAGPSSGLRLPGGSPSGPAWSGVNPFDPDPGPPTPTPTPTGNTSTPSSTPTSTRTLTPTSTRSLTPAPSTASPTPSLTATATPTATSTPTRTPTATPTATPTSSLTMTASSTASATSTPTSSAAPTYTSTQTPTSSSTVTPAPSATRAPTLIPSVTPGGLVGDLTQDGIVDVVDLQLCINVVLGTETDPGIVQRADLSSDGSANIVDVQQLVNIILGV
jgi:Concanavalin A-like lectin/glucanases superfamily/Dockerin type I domain